MKILKKVTNGILLVIIGIMHTQCALSAGGFGKQFHGFAQSGFFKISRGLEEFPAMTGRTNFETFAAFWFFYFGILVIPLGLLVHSMERKGIALPYSFTISYLIIVLIGSYMIPCSGMTYFMLPQAVYMLISNYVKARKSQMSNS
ncbi:DUF6463 family protein [uncultured Acetobacteroides sp.]|uniref:DUF6463 family protein n=1 Tax=uncultured Acetobacteroides sp. TaxID=1760811 RepID=UPI0029F557A1|nr:DUF6463 family protein [uncultured Acetobacteroides sp.]